MKPFLRLLVIALVVANIALLGWHLAAPPPPVDEPPPAVLRPVVPPDTPTILMLSEMPAPPAAEGRWCFAVGPFETIASREAAREYLLPVAGRLSERETEALVELGYWVTLPPFADFAGAGTAMRGLNQAGLQDTAVVSDDSGEYRVSLGYFLDQANARRRRDHARSLGFEADIRLQRETQPRYWLDYERAPDRAGSRAAPEGIPAAQHREISCAPVQDPVVPPEDSPPPPDEPGLPVAE
jgi:hypothetical protein